MKKHQTMQSAQAATEENPMAALLAEDFGVSRLRPGEIRDGTIDLVSPGEIFVDIGYKADAVVDSRERT